MRKILVINALTALFFAIAPHLFPIAEPLGLADPAASFAWLVTVGSTLYLLTSTALLWIAAEEKRALNDLHAVLARQAAAPTIQPLRDDDFYRAFLVSAERAETHVLIAYLGPRRPDETGRQERDSYYEELSSVMRRRTQVNFRRILRDTPSNRAWACHNLSEWTGVPNLSVALLKDLPEDQDMPLALSVQVIDKKKTWIVAVEGHERIGAFRDLSIDDPTTAEFFSKYYDRLWRHSLRIVDNGILTTHGEALQRECEEAQ